MYYTLYVKIKRIQQIGEDKTMSELESCLLYTSDAADDLLCVDLGGRRILKKKKHEKKTKKKKNRNEELTARISFSAKHSSSEKKMRQSAR